MKRLFLLIISFCAVVFSYAQKEIVLDSIQVNLKEQNTLLLSNDRPALSDESFLNSEFTYIDRSLFHQPLLPDYTKKLDISKYLNSSRISSESFSVSGFGLSPYFSTDAVFNQSAYRLSDRFSIGGSSFGAHSVFEQPRLNSGIQDMSIKGASMFMQYKVSKKFKIETRVSVSNRQSPWEP